MKTGGLGEAVIGIYILGAILVVILIAGVVSAVRKALKAKRRREEIARRKSEFERVSAEITRNGVMDEVTILSIKQRVFRIIQPSDGYWPSRVFDLVIMALILASVLSVFAETFNLPERILFAITRCGMAASIIFSVEYALRIWTADLLHPGISRWRARLRFICSGMGLVDLVAILPFWLPVLLPGHLLGIRAVRLVRLLRVFKLNRYMEALAGIGEVFQRKSRELVASCMFTCLLLLLSSLLMYHAEHDAQPEKFRNAFSGLWWAVATLTTVGYGDIYPITALGRFIGAIIAILGIGMVAIPTSILSSGFVEHFSHRVKSTVPTRCPHCGKELP